jgi:hypothetical protein
MKKGYDLAASGYDPAMVSFWKINKHLDLIKKCRTSSTTWETISLTIRNLLHGVSKKAAQIKISAPNLEFHPAPNIQKFFLKTLYCCYPPIFFSVFQVVAYFETFTSKFRIQLSFPQSLLNW